MAASAAAGGAAPTFVNGYLDECTVATFHEGSPPASPSYRSDATSVQYHKYRPLQVTRGGDLAGVYKAVKEQWAISVMSILLRTAAVAMNTRGNGEQGSQTARAAASAPVAVVKNVTYNPNQQYIVSGRYLQPLLDGATLWQAHQRAAAATSKSATAGGAVPTFVNGYLDEYTVATFHEGQPPASPNFGSDATSAQCHKYLPFRVRRGSDLANVYGALKIQWAGSMITALFRADAVAMDTRGGGEQGSQAARAAVSAPVAVVTNVTYNPNQQYAVYGRDLQSLLADSNAWRAHQRSTAAASNSNKSNK